MRGAPFWPGLEALAHTLPYEGRIMGYDGPDRSLPVERWQAIEVPVLAMVGDASPDWFQNVVRAVAGALPEATFRSLPGQTHQVDPAVVTPISRVLPRLSGDAVADAGSRRGRQGDRRRQPVHGARDRRCVGKPWATPVYYAADGYRVFYWVSALDRTHSRNVADRPDIAIVIFDSQVPIGEGQAVYMAAVGAELTGDEARAGDRSSRGCRSHGAKPWTLEDVGPPAALRLFRAPYQQHWVQQSRPARIGRTPVEL